MDILKVSQIHDVCDQIYGVSLQTWSSFTIPSHSKWHHHLSTCSGHSLLYLSFYLIHHQDHCLCYFNIHAIYFSLQCYLHSVLSYHYLLSGHPLTSLYIHPILHQIYFSIVARVNNHFKTHIKSSNPCV